MPTLSDVLGGSATQNINAQTTNATSFNGASSYASTTGKTPGISGVSSVLTDEQSPGAQAIQEGSGQKIGRPGTEQLPPGALPSGVTTMTMGDILSQLGMPATNPTPGNVPQTTAGGAAQQAGGSQINVSPDGAVKITTAGGTTPQPQGTQETPAGQAVVSLKRYYEMWRSSQPTVSFVDWMRELGLQSLVIQAMTEAPAGQNTLDAIMGVRPEDIQLPVATSAPTTISEILAGQPEVTPTPGVTQPPATGTPPPVELTPTPTIPTPGITSPTPTELTPPTVTPPTTTPPETTPLTPTPTPTPTPTRDLTPEETTSENFTESADWKEYVGQLEKAYSLRADAALSKTAQMYDAARRRQAATGGRGFSAAYAASSQALDRDQLRAMSEIVNSSEMQLATDVATAMYAERTATREDRKWLAEFNEQRHQFDVATTTQINQWAAQNNIAVNTLTAQINQWAAQNNLSQQQVSFLTTELNAQMKLSYDQLNTQATQWAAQLGLDAETLKAQVAQWNAQGIRDSNQLAAQVAQWGAQNGLSQQQINYMYQELNANISQNNAQLQAQINNWAGQLGLSRDQLAAQVAQWNQQNAIDRSRVSIDAQVVAGQLEQMRSQGKLTDAQVAAINQQLAPLAGRTDLDAMVANAQISQIVKSNLLTDQQITTMQAEVRAITAQIAGQEAQTEQIKEQTAQLIANRDVTRQMIQAQIAAVQSSTALTDQQKATLLNDLKALSDREDLAAQIAKSTIKTNEAQIGQEDERIGLLREQLKQEEQRWMAGLPIRADQVDAIVEQWAMDNGVDSSQARLLAETMKQNYANQERELNLPERQLELQKQVASFQTTMATMDFFATTVPEMAGYLIEGFVTNLAAMGAGFDPATGERIKGAMPEIVSTMYMNEYGESFSNEATLRDKLDLLLKPYAGDHTQLVDSLVVQWRTQRAAGTQGTGTNTGTQVSSTPPSQSFVNEVTNEWQKWFDAGQTQNFQDWLINKNPGLWQTIGASGGLAWITNSPHWVAGRSIESS